MSATFMGGNVKMFNANSPFKKRLVRRPPPVPQSYDDYLDNEADNLYEVTPPRSIKLGNIVDEYSGELIGEPYMLPIHDELHDPAVVVIGASGSGKTVTVSRLIDELRRDYARSLLILDAKNQYVEMNLANQDEGMCNILRENGEEPEGAENLKVFIPKNIIKKYGEEMAKEMFHYTHTWKIRTSEIDATGLLMIGQKAMSDRDYVNVIAAVIDNLNEEMRNTGHETTIDDLMMAMQSEVERVPQKKRSIDPLIAMLDNLHQSSMLGDDGNSVLELLQKPYTRVYKTRDGDYKYVTKKAGDVTVFNSCGNPQNITTKGLITNIINSLCNKLIFEFDKKTRIPLYRPILVIEEASMFYGKKSDSDMVDAISQLQDVVGRSIHCMRIFVYQYREQAISGFLENDNVSCIINMVQSMNLRNHGDPDDWKKWTGRQVSMKGLAIVEIRNVSFMPDWISVIQVLPSKCQVRS